MGAKRLRAAATGKKGGISQRKLAGLRVYIVVRLHGALKQALQLYVFSVCLTALYFTNLLIV